MKAASLICSVAIAGLLLSLALPCAANDRENVDITLTQVYNPWWPLEIWYKTRVTNNESTPVTCDIWNMIQMSNGLWFGPTFGPIRISLPAGVTAGRLRWQFMPATAPSGTYLLYGYVGDYPAVKWDSSGFSFYWPPWPGDGEPEAGDWLNTGEPFYEYEAASAPSGFIMHGAFPNPFNPMTTITFALPKTSKVNLAIHNVSGRLVATLVNGWRDAGYHSTTFDGSKMASGVYIYRIQAGEFTASGKMVLMK